MDGRFITYFRVSTRRQGASGLGLEAQQAAVASYLNGGKWAVLASFTEVESGTHNDRPQLAAALRECRLTGSTLLVAKLDRLARNAAFLLNLRDAGVAFVAADMPQANSMTIGILACVAQGERDAISARTKAALAAAKARGTVLGGIRANTVPVDPAAGLAARQRKAAAFAADVAPIATDLRAQGMSLRQIAAALTERGILTPRGKMWTAAGVNGLLAP